MKKTLFKTFIRIVKYKKSESCVWKLCSQIGWRPHPVSKELVWPSLYLHIGRKTTSVTSHQALTRETHFFCSYRKSCFFMYYKRILWNACARMCVSTWKFWGEKICKFLHPCVLEFFCQFLGVFLIALLKRGRGKRNKPFFPWNLKYPIFKYLLMNLLVSVNISQMKSWYRHRKLLPTVASISMTKPSGSQNPRALPFLHNFPWHLCLVSV